jgi:hypothetical protein
MARLSTAFSVFGTALHEGGWNIHALGTNGHHFASRPIDSERVVGKNEAACAADAAREVNGAVVA